MFESIVSEILTKYLGKFVKGLDKENLKIAIWGGDVVLKDLEIRVSALANLNLPVAVKSGTRHRLQPLHDAALGPIFILFTLIHC